MLKARCKYCASTCSALFLGLRHNEKLMNTMLEKNLAVSRAEQVATRVAFFIAGFALGAWAPLVPYAKMRAELNEAQLGILLLCIGGGSMLTMPFSSVLAARFGCRAILTTTSLVMGLSLPFLAWLSSVPALAAALLLFGASLGLFDVTMNILATIMEQRNTRSQMSSYHGFFSVGGLVGSVLMSGLLWLGFTPLLSIAFPVALIGSLLILFGRHWLSESIESDGPHFAWPRGKVFLLGILCFITFLVEGAILDWGAVFLTTLRDVAKSQGGFGYAAFAVAMTIGRLTGDYWVAFLGRKAILLGGGICAALGLALVVTVPIALVALLGFALVGIGASNIVPIFFTQAGRQKIMAPGAAIAAITTMGYVGGLAGPALIGFVAHASNLAIALGLVALSLFAVPLTTKRVMAEN